MALDFSGLPDKAEPSIGESPGGLDFSGLPDSNTDSLKGSYRQAPKPADTYSQIDNLAESTGLPKTVVENDMPSAQSLSDEPDWDAVPPKLSNVLANDLDLFKIAKDDTENLGSIERSAKAFGAGAAQATIGISKSIHETPESIARASEYLSQSLERLTGLPRMFDPLRAVQYTAEYFARGKIPGTGIQTGGMTDIANRIGEAQNILNQESETFGRLNEKGRQADEALKNFLFGRQRTLESLIRGDTGEKPPELTDLLTDPEAWAGFIGQAAPSLYLAYRTGGSIPFIAWLEGLDAADSALEFEQLTGQKLSPQQFSQAMAQSALINAALEKYGLDKVFGKTTGNFLSDIIKRTLAEGGTEALQQLNSNAAAYAAYNPEQDLTQGVMGSMMGGAGTGGIAGGATSISMRIANRAEAREVASNRANAMDAITKAAVDSKLRGRNKEAFSRVMNQVLGDEAEDVYMSGDDAVDFFQSNPEAFDVIKENLPEVFESIQEATETGGDIVIPAKDYITYLSDFHEQIGDKIRVGAEGVSLSEAQKWRDVDAEKFKAEADQILQQREIEDGADEIQRSIRDEIMATGRFTEDVANQYAAIHRAFSVAMSSRLGITPQEVYDKYKLRVRVPPPAAEPSPPPGEAAVPGGTLFEQQVKTPIPLEQEVEQLRTRVAELETELRTSKVTGLRNKTAFDEDEGLGMASVGAGDMDGLKRLNDTIGHKAADAVLKTLGDVMLSAEAATEGAKAYHISGDEFAFRFDSDAAGQAFLDNLQRRLENVNVELDVETPEGVVHYVYEGIGLSFGVGANYEIADQNAAKQKVERLAAGIREEARVPGAPRRLREIAGRESVVGAAYESQLSSAFGIEVSQLSDQEYQDAADLFDKLRASRSVLQTEGSTGRTVAQDSPAETWTSQTTIVGKNGEPALVYRGANRALSQDDFGREALGFNTGFPASGLGVWFTSDPDEASAYGANVEPFNLDIRNPKVFTVAGDEDLPDFDSVLDALSFRDQLKEKGHDGIVIDLRDIGGGFHAVAFSPNQAIRPSEEFYQDKPSFADIENALSALHNLTFENLIFADEMGGLAAPSIGVVRDDMGISGYGEITMIGTRDLADPKYVEVFDADAYTSTFPQPEYKRAKRADAQKIMDEIRPFAEKMEGKSYTSTMDTFWDYTTGNAKVRPQRAIDDMLRDNAVKALFLKTVHGIDVNPVMEKTKPDPEFLDKKIIRDFIKKHGIQLNAEMDSDYHKEFSKAFISALNEQGYRKNVHDAMMDMYVDSDTGLLYFGPFDRGVRSLQKIGKKEIDKYATEKRIGTKLKGKEAEFHSWVMNKVLSIMGDPMLTLNRKKVPYTLPNIVEYMTRAGTKAKEETMTFGPGKARAAAAISFSDLNEMRNRAQTDIGTEEEISEKRDEANKLMEDYRDKVLEFSTITDWKGEVDVWDSLDASMKVLSKWANSYLKKGNDRAMKDALRSEGFKGVSQEVVDMAIEAGQAMIYAPVPYFEAKPARAVDLSEFKGAAIPKGTPKEITDILDKNGIEWKVYGEKFDEEARRKTVVSLRKKLAEDGFETLFQPPKLAQEKRGAIQFGRDVSTQESVIRLFKDADLSTFIHESGHFFFEVMTDIARQEGAPQEIKDDIQKILDWYGVEDLEAWTSISADKRRLHHEQFARGFEAYMFEGKAPSIELKGIFQRFRSWLVSIYRSIRNLDVTLTDEVRGVMDRMLATEEQIKAAEAAVNYRPLFDSIEQARMTKTEWDAYRTLNEEARADAQADLDKRSLRDMKWLANAKSKVLKQLQRDAATKRKAVAREMADELAKEPIYHAINFFKTGEMTGPEGEEIKVLQGFKLNKNEILDYFPTEELAILDLRKLKGLTSASDGMNADLAAQMFGFKNGEQLARTILAAPTLKEAIEARTDETMIERYGDISNPEEMEKAANEAIHNEARARFVASEMRALDRQVGKTSEIIRAAKQYAIETIAGKLVKEAIKPAKYRTAEARASRDAEAALKKDDIAKAAQYKRSQILNMHMAKASEDAAVEVDKAINYLKKFEKKSVRKNLRGDMLVQLDSLLTRFDLRKAPAPVGEKPTLTEWAQSEADRLDAVMPNLDPIATNEGIKKHYKDLTLDELRGLRDTVKQLEHMARREQKLYLERRNLSFEKEKLAILDEMRQAHPEIFDEEGQPMPYRKDRLPLLKEFRNRFQSKLDGEMINVENILDIMTLGHGNQIFDSLFSRLSEAQDAQTAMMKKLGKFLDPYTKAYTLKERAGFSMAASRVFVPEVGEYFTRDKRVAVALFYGSLDGRQRLKDGNNYTDNQIKAILRTLSDKDLDFVEAMWEMSDEIIWPELKALDERTKGVAAKKIDPAPFVINGRPMRGGYVPLVYDGDLSTRAYDLNTDNAIKELRGGTATQATTRQSASKQRLEEVKRPLDLSLSAISYKINETVHDVTHREAVTDTYRLLKSNRLSNAIRSIAGPNVYKALLTKVRETAMSPAVPHGITERGLWYLRRNTMINMMGASFNTVAINVLGASPAIRRVGPLRFIRALQRFTSTGAKARYNWVLEKSPYMKERIDGFDRDLNTEVNRFTGKAGITPSMGVWFAGLSIMDRSITMPTWMAAYEKSMEESGNNEDLSVQYADRVVRQTQGSGRTIDLAKVSGGVGPAGEFKRIITMYYNFFSAQYGQMVRSKRLSAKEWNEGRRIKAAMQFTLDTLAIIVIPATLEAIARGNCGDDPDAEDYMYCTVRSSALFWTSMFPLVRDMVPFAWHQFDPETQAFGVRLSPVENAMETLAKTPKSMADVFADEATDSDVRTLLRGLGYAFGLPGFQASRTLEGYQAFADGETDNPMALLTGAPK